MRKRMNKRGQIYLLAAIIIIMIIMAIGTTANYIVTKPRPYVFYDLSKWVGPETYRVIDHSIYKEKDTSEMIRNFTDEYFVKYLEQKETNTTGILFVYGNYDNLKIVNYESATVGTVGLNVGGQPFNFDVNGVTRKEVSLDPQGKSDISVMISNSTYSFTLNKGENFIFMIKKCEAGECYVVST